MFIVKAMKYFHNGNLKGLSVDWSVKETSLEAATKTCANLMRHTKKPMKDLQGKKVTFHCIRIDVE